MPAQKIPDIVVGRLPKYLHALQMLHLQGVTTTSSLELGEKVGITAAQIRKDLSLFGEFGKQGTGYAIPFLIEQLQNILHVNRVWEIALVGAGDLGHAIARYGGFANRGFRISMLFDSDPQKIGSRVGNFEVLDVAALEAKLRESGIQIAMITVPAAEAQKIANVLVDAGVRAILNYAPVTLSVPEGVYVEMIDPIIQLQHMTYYLNNSSG